SPSVRRLRSGRGAAGAAWTTAWTAGPACASKSPRLVCFPPIQLDDVVDTLPMARRKHPGAANNLAARCNRYGSARSRRTKHGALPDAQILAEVYVKLLGGKQTGPDRAPILATPAQSAADAARPIASRVFNPRLTDAERELHASFR
ncbi:hypothetical protein MKK65_28800, partial [Methylobacterium sp. J-001]|nr:hypothetical protein [Methylobacterium sp. J-001]